ncbi:MAG: 3-deoxy-manno-octulosonate cytidylyltransferase (CMP-KDO synthetase) [Arenicella sp.]|jgi:3-deoxy-manno-octulosonate cytidylyltransferase (CMP-KDO synthetase)
MNFENIKVVIPARYGSTRLHGKALLLIQGKPLFWHVAQRCLESGIELDNIVIATDDQRIVTVAQSLKLSVLLTSIAHQSGTDRICEVANTLKWPTHTVVINVQGDEPLIPNLLIKAVASFKVNNPQYSIATAVVPLTKYDDFINPNVVKAVMGENGRALYFTRSASPLNRSDPADLSLSYRHVGIYAYTVESLNLFCSFAESPLEAYERLEQLRALTNGLTIGASIFYGDVAHGVDTSEDFEEIKQLMETE